MSSPPWTFFKSMLRVVLCTTEDSVAAAQKLTLFTACKKTNLYNWVLKVKKKKLNSHFLRVLSMVPPQSLTLYFAPNKKTDTF